MCKINERMLLPTESQWDKKKSKKNSTSDLEVQIFNFNIKFFHKIKKNTCLGLLIAFWGDLAVDSLCVIVFSSKFDPADGPKK